MQGTGVFICLVLLSNVAYHCCQKVLSSSGKPFLTLSVTYFISFCLTLLLSWRQESWGGGVGRVLPIFGLSLALIGIESGFLFAYHAGGNMGVLSAVVGPLSSAMLLVLGLVWFGEGISAVTLGGIVLSVLGVTLMRLGEGL